MYLEVAPVTHFELYLKSPVRPCQRFKVTVDLVLLPYPSTRANVWKF